MSKYFRQFTSKEEHDKASSLIYHRSGRRMDI